MSFFGGGAHTCALSSIRLRRCLVLVASKIRVPKSYVATGGCKIGIEKSDVKKSESFNLKKMGVGRGGDDILNYNNVATSMDGHCYFCTCMPLYYLHETCCVNPEHCLKSNIVLFGILDEDKKLSFRYFIINDTTRLQFIFTAQLLIHNDKTLSLALL